MQNSAVHRLEELLAAQSVTVVPGSIRPLTPDASTREYFRIDWQTGQAIACVYPRDAAGDAQLAACEDVTGLFIEAGLPVAEILISDPQRGIIIHSDFGDVILRDVIERSDSDEREKWISDAIRLIARVQAATPLAYKRDSIASRLSFDFEKLSWELNFFKEHYFGSLRGRDSDSIRSEFSDELDAVARDLAGRANVLTHRDFHAANLMVSDGELKIIDHQDARIGSATYDLVSLLLDRVTSAPSAEWLASKREFLLAERESLGLPDIDRDEFASEFRLQTIQRCLKAIGTFSFQSAIRGKTRFEQYIDPMFEIVLRAARNIGKYPAIESVIAAELA